MIALTKSNDGLEILLCYFHLFPFCFQLGCLCKGRCATGRRWWCSSVQPCCYTPSFCSFPSSGRLGTRFFRITDHGIQVCWLWQLRATVSGAVLLFAGLVEIPEEIIEAARIDGARGWTLSRFIVMPLMTWIIISSLIFSLNGTLKVFDSITALTGGGPGTTTMPLTMYMYRVSFSHGDYGYGRTVALILALQCVLVTLLIFWRARKDVS